MGGPRIGSLFSGTGALDLAVMDVFGGQVVWHSQYEPPDKNGREDKNQYAAKILARHWPETPNLGDVTAIDWQAVLAEHGPIDILTGGFPCQDVSSAGKRAGLTADSRSGLWAHFARAIHELRPRLVVIENVEGLLSAEADRGLEPGAEAVGEDAGAGGVLRALGAVLGDLATLGLHAEWARVAASEVGAPHSRKRVFIYAWPADADTEGLGYGSRELSFGESATLSHARSGGLAAADAQGAGLQGMRSEPSGRGPERSGPASANTHGVEPERWGVAGVLGGQAAAEPGEGDQRERAGDAAGDRGEAVADADGRGRERNQKRDRGPQDGQPEREPGLDPLGRGVQRPAPSDAEGIRHGDSGTEGERGLPAAAVAGGHPAGGGAAPSDTDLLGRRADVLQLRPGQPDLDWGGRTAMAERRRIRRRQRRSFRRRAKVLNLRQGQPDLDWGDYGPAIRRWEAILGRRAPWPTDALGRLSPVFTEWLMGLPDGWVTATPGLTRSAMLRALGNGVVRLQGAVAIGYLHTRSLRADAAAAA